jgi:rod shape determining protein RodA
MWSKLKTFDPLLFIVPIIFSAVSIIFIYVLTFDRLGASLAIRQGIFVGVGLVAMAILTFVDYRAWRAWRWWMYVFLIAFLVATIFIGTKVFGATSWIDIGPFQFQPSEIGKIILIVLLASILQTRGTMVKTSQFWLAVGVFIVPIVLIMMQPDFGTTLIVTMLGLGMFLHARLQRWQRYLVIGVACIAALTIVFSFKNIGPFGGLLKDYQKKRLASFIDPTVDTSGSGYNVLQSKIAVGSGGVLGRGLGYGSQSQLNFLPVVHTDFIFSAIAESWGIIGSYGILALFALLIARVTQAARHAQDEFGYLACIGLASMMTFQVLVNVGMNIGIMPVTGIPLPFLSYGGTAFITYCLGVGLIQAIVVRSKRLTF